MDLETKGFLFSSAISMADNWVRQSVIYSSGGEYELFPYDWAGRRPTKKINGEKEKMSSNDKYYRPGHPVFADDANPFTAGQVISVTSRRGDGSNPFLITSVRKNDDMDDDGNAVGGIYYAGYSSDSYGDSRPQVILVKADSAVTVWSEYEVIKTPKDVKSFNFPEFTTPAVESTDENV